MPDRVTPIPDITISLEVRPRFADDHASMLHVSVGGTECITKKDSLRLAASLNAHLDRLGRDLDAFIQVNTFGEESKFGLHPRDLPAFVEDLPPFPRLRPRGLMTLAMFTSDKARVRPCFSHLRSLRDQASCRNGDITELSMGMSGDFEAAIEEGATVVRVGQAIFGRRPTPDSEYWPEAHPDDAAAA